jgi:hypothetical protein
MKWPSLQKSVSKLTPNSFMRLTPGINRTQLFLLNLLTLYSKLDHFIDIINIDSFAMKRSSFQKRVNKFTPKKHYETGPLSRSHKNFFGGKGTHSFFVS